MRAVLYLSGVLLLMTLTQAEGPVNLACTSLAEVSGGPINGGRSIDNPYYGVPNLFDGGAHMINAINYNYWLGHEAKPYDWVTVRFAASVTVTEVQVEAPAGIELPLTGDPQASDPAPRVIDQGGTQPLLVLLYRGEVVAAELTVTIPRRLLTLPLRGGGGA